MPKNAPKAILLGWDGGTFDVLRPLLDAGRMPHTARLMEEGASGPLASTIPALTPVAWTSCYTGVNPGKHGVFDVLAMDLQARRMRLVNATIRQREPIWSLLSRRGRRVGVFNTPMTYPVDAIQGYHVAGMFTPAGVEDWVHPPGLLQRITQRHGDYQHEPPSHRDPVKSARLLVDSVAKRTDVLLSLLEEEPCDLHFAVFTESDRAQHRFWEYRDPAHPRHRELGSTIDDVYQALDASLGRIREAVGRETPVVIVSDHGAGPLTRGVFLNKWLMEQGFLHLKGDLAGAARRSVTDKVKGKLRRLAGRQEDEAIEGMVTGQNVDMDKDLFWRLVDWEKSKAFSEGSGNAVYFNHAILQPGEAATLTQALREGMLAIQDPETGRKPFAAVRHRDELYHGEMVPNAPDLVAECAPGYHVTVFQEILVLGGRYEDSLFLKHPWSGRHEPDGIFLTAGPETQRNATLEGARIIDVAPTLLHLLDEPIPADMDGRVLAEAFTPEALTNRPVQLTHDDAETTATRETTYLSDDDEAQITQRLKDLGYL